MVRQDAPPRQWHAELQAAAQRLRALSSAEDNNGGAVDDSAEGMYGDASEDEADYSFSAERSEAVAQVLGCAQSIPGPDFHSTSYPRIAPRQPPHNIWRVWLPLGKHVLLFTRKLPSPAWGLDAFPRLVLLASDVLAGQYLHLL